jgi:WhiB family transcriptional regulator, redox-sensing transcriptional regulator
MPLSDPATGSSRWMSRGACQHEDPELFFPIAAVGPALDQVSAAKAVCRRCMVRPRCLIFGLETRQDGIWGGTTSEERRTMRDHLAPGPAFPGSPGYVMNGRTGEADEPA